MIHHSFCGLHLDSYHGMANNFVSEDVSCLEFFAHHFYCAVAVIHTDRFVVAGVKDFTNSFNALDTHVLQSLFELFDDSLYTLNVVVVVQISRHVLEGALEVINDWEQFPDNIGFDDSLKTSDLLVMTAANVSCIGSFALQSLC